MATVTIIDDFIRAPSHARPGVTHPKKWIIIHETCNCEPGASAESYARYIREVAEQDQLFLSWHYTVDDSAVYRHIPDDEVAWHAGGRKSPDGGDLAGIGIEICVNPESNFDSAVDKAARLAARLLCEHGLPVTAVRQHHDFSGGSCPRRLRQGGRWEQFMEAVRRYYGAACAPKPLRQGGRVYVSGMLYDDSYGGTAMRRIEGEFDVTLLMEERPAGVLLDGSLGWVHSEDCTPI